MILWIVYLIYSREIYKLLHNPFEKWALWIFINQLIKKVAPYLHPDGDQYFQVIVDTLYFLAYKALSNCE